MYNKKIIVALAVVVVFISIGCLVQESDDSEDVEKELSENEEEFFEIKGVYIKRVDPIFIEILHEDKFEMYIFKQDEEFLIESDEIEKYSGVDIVYFLNQEGQKNIKSMELANPAGVGISPEIEMQGQIEEMFGADKCIIEEEPYWLAYELMLSSSKFVQKGDYIDFDYYIDDYGRKVITSYIKIFTECGRFERIEAKTLYVKLMGNPDEIEAKEYLLSDEIIKKLDNIRLKKGEVIQFQYIYEKENLKKIISLELRE